MRMASLRFTCLSFFFDLIEIRETFGKPSDNVLSIYQNDIGGNLSDEVSDNFHHVNVGTTYLSPPIVGILYILGVPLFDSFA